MSIGASTLLFFDSACLVAAAGSVRGGSSYLLSICRRQMLRCAISEAVLEETESSIQDNLNPGAWLRYQEHIKTLPFLVAPTATEAEIAIAQPITGDKDAHVLAAALRLDALYIISLDRKLVRRINEAGFGIQAMSPGAFIELILPLHPDHHLMRE